MPLTAVLAVLLAAAFHATWNLYAKRAAGSHHFVWLYSTCSVILYLPFVAWLAITTGPRFGAPHWLALAATAVLHLGYSLSLQAGYRASDLSLVYPLARGSGPLLSFFAAAILLGEPVTWLSLAGVMLVVAGIVLVAGLLWQPHKAPRAGIALGLLTGAFIAAYTINDGWAVKVLLIAPLFIDYTGNLFRVLVLSPRAWMDRARVRTEMREYLKPALVVAVLGPAGYMLVLYAMRQAPVGHVAPMRELGTLIGTWFGARLLQEKAAPARIAGAACIVVGVISLAVAG